MTKQRIPNFYCIGAQKAGTTTLHKIMIQHPNIYLPKSKEAHFFHKDELYENGLEWYLEKFFKDAADEKIIGSITPGYLFSEKAAERIYNAFGPDMKFIVILRNPVDRAYSNYKMNRYRGLETLSFEEAILEEKKRTEKNKENRLWYSYIERGYYYKHLSRFFEFYPVEKFLLINFEDELKKKPNQMIARISKFLEITCLDLNTEIKANVSKKAQLPKLNKLLMYKPPLLRWFSGFIPKKIKRSTRKIVLRINSKELDEYSLDPDFKKQLLHEYYFRDIKNLEEKLNFSNQWL